MSGEVSEAKTGQGGKERDPQNNQGNMTALPCIYLGVSSLNEGLFGGAASQHAAMVSASPTGQLGGRRGRNPFCTTPTAAWRGVMLL